MHVACSSMSAHLFSAPQHVPVQILELLTFSTVSTGEPSSFPSFWIFCHLVLLELLDPLCGVFLPKPTAAIFRIWTLSLNFT
jgi:hypothetical protein